MATANASGAMKVVVIGGTGATGMCLVRLLLAAPERYSKVILIGRRKVSFPEEDEGGINVEKEEATGRLVQHITPSLDDVPDEKVKELCEGSQTFFSVIGTTRRTAGSAQAFYHVDCEIVARYAKLAKEAGVTHFSLLTSARSHPNSMFLYLRTKGEVEQKVRELKFPKTSIFQPGTLKRGADSRFLEKVVVFLTQGLPVATLAKGMEEDAYKYFSEGKPSDSPEVHLFSTSDIRAMVPPTSEKKEVAANEGTPASEPAHEEQTPASGGAEPSATNKGEGEKTTATNEPGEEKVGGEEEKVGGEEEKVGGEEEKVGGEEEKVGGEEEKVGGEEEKVGGEKEKVGGEEERVGGDEERVGGEDEKAEEAGKEVDAPTVEGEGTENTGGQ